CGAIGSCAPYDPATGVPKPRRLTTRYKSGQSGHERVFAPLTGSLTRTNAERSFHLSEPATMRIAIGQLWQETNTFNPLPTTRADFEQFGVLRGAELVQRMADTNELGGFIQSLGRWPERPEIAGLARLPAWPSGIATAETFEWLRDELVIALEQ